MVSVKDVAAAASVSVGTVSHVLNHPERVAPATVARVQRAIEELGFVRNDAARQLRAGRSRSIGLIVLDLRNPFFADLARGADDRAAQEGLSLLVADSAHQVDREGRHLALFAEQRMSGVLLSPVGEDLSAAEKLVERGTPVVLVDRKADNDSYSSVWVNDVEGGRVAAEHLLSRGRRRLAFVGGPSSLRQVRDRLEGASQAIDSTGATLEFIRTDELTVSAGRKAATNILARDRRDRPDAIFAANDLLALGILERLIAADDVRVPDDIALVGYDDIDFSASAVIPLTSVRQPAVELGRTAVELIIENEHPRDYAFEPQLVVRSSS